MEHDDPASPEPPIPADLAEDLRDAYREGFAAALRGEEAAPGCTVTAQGRAWLRGYVEGAAAR